MKETIFSRLNPRSYSFNEMELLSKALTPSGIEISKEYFNLYEGAFAKLIKEYGLSASYTEEGRILVKGELTIPSC